MSDVLTHARQVTPDWLTEVLQRQGNLVGDSVSDVKVASVSSTNVSDLYFLELNYTNTGARAPQRLFLKVHKSSLVPAHVEAEFYTNIVPEMAQRQATAPQYFPVCYDVAFAPATNQSHLLLEDLSPTHFTNPEYMPPTPEYCEMVIDAYGHFHAFWWEHAWLGHQVGTFLTHAAIDESLTAARTKFAQFRQVVGSELSRAQYGALEAVVTDWPTHRRQRVIDGKGVTVVHRDPHPLNILYPKSPERSSVKLIDWQSWRVDTGTDDLAYLMACHWPLEKLLPIEQKLLQRYHAQLTELGVSGYDWDACAYDYRASIIRCLFFLMIAWSPTKWASETGRLRFANGLAAFERWNCLDLLMG